MRLRAAWIIGLLTAGAIAGCAADAARGEPSPHSGEERVRYVALGDSYTIGTSVTEAERWPNQLAARIGDLELVANLGVNGYTSADLITDQLPRLDELRPELVTLLVGVNDVVQDVPDANYASNVAIILDELTDRLARDRIVCVATPDYTRTPRGAQYGDPDLQSDRIVRINAILREACEQRRITFVPEIFELSQAASDEPDLVAEDGLHPSGEQYRRWVDAIAPVVEVLLVASPNG
jgi:lysophospholipase L1-like esterase